MLGVEALFCGIPKQKPNVFRFTFQPDNIDCSYSVPYIISGAEVNM